MSLTFLHLSDIHFASPAEGNFDLDIAIRNELERSVAEKVKEFDSITGVLVTGDFVYRGAVSGFGEAANWLSKLCGILGCRKEEVWTVPGNHDVSRAAVSGSKLNRDIHSNIRSAARSTELDKTLREYLLEDKTAAEIVFKKLEDYNSFAAQYNCKTSPDQLFWQDDLPFSDGSKLRLVGLNSAIVSDGNDNLQEGKLVLGSAQVKNGLLRQDGVVNVVLCHHPPEWLHDIDTEKDFRTLAFVQLLGHKHSFDLVPTGSSVKISAGAVHPEREVDWEPRFNFLQFDVRNGKDGGVFDVTVHPHVWDSRVNQFKKDYNEKGEPHPSFAFSIPPFVPPNAGESENELNFVEEALETEPNTFVMTESIDKEGIRDPAKRLVYRFYALPNWRQIKIGVDLELFGEDEEFSRDSIGVQICNRAKKAKKLELLWEATEDAHGAPAEPNPFRGY